jgi:phosphoenolpyruvate synthase/pyruvate phosphate dikinase
MLAAMPLIVQFPGKERTTRAEVGGKATSLIRMSEAGLPVPPGAVLTSTFFAPWIEETKASATWAKLIEAAPDHWVPFCSELERGAKTLSLTVERRDALHVMVRQLVAPSDEARLAVRSSSPEEDLASASFAGLYATRLGVRPDDIEDAVRDCFASSLNLRVLAYKKEHGFDLWAPRFAVIVQRQIDSEVAGVGFSLNPVTNDYDEAVISANWGLGTSVVEGLVTPDHFVVNKVERQVVEETRGAKHLSIWLEPCLSLMAAPSNGGTTARRNVR